jgi:hypothetical protein
MPPKPTPTLDKPWRNVPATDFARYTNHCACRLRRDDHGHNVARCATAMQSSNDCSGGLRNMSSRPLHSIRVLTACLASLPLVSRVGGGEPLVDKESSQAQTGAGTMLFEDSMLADWQQNWFLDGKRAILGHTDEGLWIYCTPSGVNKQ